jgi:hypothetical protein
MGPGLKDACLDRITPFAPFFELAFEKGESIAKNQKIDRPDRGGLTGEPEILEKEIKHEGKILKITIFHVDVNRILGGIIQDVTLPAGKRDNIIKKAEQVITKNLQTVQKIAYLLGENAAESEIILNSIIESFGKTPDNQETDQ